MELVFYGKGGLWSKGNEDRSSNCWSCTLLACQKALGEEGGRGSGKCIEFEVAGGGEGEEEREMLEGTGVQAIPLATVHGLLGIV